MGMGMGGGDSEGVMVIFLAFVNCTDAFPPKQRGERFGGKF
jgi:hypothetical protein